jgi:rhodanese-related sulfurtransferase
LYESGAYILDVRETYEVGDEGRIKNVHNIPLSQLRDRMEEIPKDIPVYAHCRSGQRSYNAVLALQAKGYKQVYNISAGFMGVRSYEYYRDITTGREPIIAEYGF